MTIEPSGEARLTAKSLLEIANDLAKNPDPVAIALVINQAMTVDRSGREFAYAVSLLISKGTRYRGLIGIASFIEDGSVTLLKEEEEAR